jgi:nucleoside-diphosphate-sugar epimerase
VFVSSYTVHGHRNPFRQTGLLTGDTPVAPFDNYGHHKVLGEAMARDSGLSWTIVRLPAVAATDLTWGTKRAFTLFGFLLDPRRREHVLHASDAGLGLAHAITARDAVGRTFDLGGGDDCRVTGAQFSEIMHHARRISTFPKTAYRQSDPDVDESWYCEDWIDTAESQEILAYQRHTMDDYVRELRRAMGARDYLIAAIFPLVRGRVLKVSPYHDKPFVPDATPMWQAVATHFGLEGDPSSPSRIG